MIPSSAAQSYDVMLTTADSSCHSTETQIKDAALHLFSSTFTGPSATLSPVSWMMKNEVNPFISCKGSTDSYQRVMPFTSLKMPSPYSHLDEDSSVHSSTTTHMGRTHTSRGWLPSWVNSLRLTACALQNSPCSALCLFSCWSWSRYPTLSPSYASVCIVNIAVPATVFGLSASRR